jgi:TonB-linked SusC/RagA family outer membrane protein
MKYSTLLQSTKTRNYPSKNGGSRRTLVRPSVAGCEQQMPAATSQVRSLLQTVFVFALTLVVSGSLTAVSAQTSGTIQGVVVNQQGAPLSTVSVVVKETRMGTSTDTTGRFSINAKRGQTLIFSIVGYSAREWKIVNEDLINIMLAGNATSLEDVVVVGYGVQKKASLTSAVSSISASQIVTTKNENILNTLTGKIPGLRVIQNTSEPGSFNNSFDIRGMGNPLIVVDGIPRSDIARIDPNDVESVSVLKDASAAVYGARAANGVILVTTKKGKRGVMELSYVGTYGWQIPTGFPTSSNAVEYMTLVNELSMHNVNGGSRVYTDAQINEYRNGTKQSTDWQKATINRQAAQTQHSLSATGGSENVNYFFSLGYTSQDGILKSGDLFYKKYNLRSNVSAKISKDLTLDLNLTGIMERKDQPMQAAYWVFRSMWYQPPVNPVYANNNPQYLNSIPNPLHPVAQSTSDIAGNQVFNNKWFQSSAALNYNIPFVKGLSARAVYSFDYTLNNNKIFNKAYNLYNYNAATDVYTVAGTQQAPSTVRREFYEYPTTLGQFSLNYNRTFLNTHHVTALALYEQSHRIGDNFFAQRELAIPVEQLFAGNSTNQQGNMSSNILNSFDYQNAAWVGVVTYDYKSKYFGKFAFRYDGSSKFTPAKQYGFFPDYEIGWRISEEDFFRNIDAFRFINSLKVRASYGETGDDGALRYQFLTGYTYPASGSATGQPAGAVFDGTFTNAVQSTGIANPAISWYTAKTLDIGLDVEAWRGRLGFSIDYFRRDRTGLLASRALTVPDVVGAGLPQENLNGDRNEGFDFEVRHENRIGKLAYSIRGTFGYTRISNRYIERARSGNSYLNWLQNNTNRYTGVYFGYGSDGKFENYQDIEHSNIYVPRSTVVGDYRYLDWNGDGQVGVDDSYPIANSGLPLITFGLNFGATYKGFDINLLFSGAAMVKATYLEQLGGPLWASGNALTMWLDRYHPEDPNADPYDPNTKWVPGYYSYTGTNAFTNTLHNLHDATYIRLKSAEIGYSLPERLTSRAGIKGLRVFVTGYNVFTITGLKYLDPEHPSVLSVVDQQFGYAYPIDKIFSFGLNLKF